MTVCGFIDTCQKNGLTSLIQDAAASSLGKMLVRFAAKHNITTINIVRKQEQEDTLKELGAQHILNSGSPNFAENLQKLITELGTKIYFSAIGGGEVPNTVLRLLPDKSHAF